MVGHGESSAGSYLVDPTSPISSHCASIVATSTLRVKFDTICVYLAACECNMYGSEGTTCDDATGQCQCKPHYVGRDCGMCEVRSQFVVYSCIELVCIFLKFDET